MVRQHNYSLRKRRERNVTRRESFPKPQIGDTVSIFWEALDRTYDGTLARFDECEKTFLVDYDHIPDGYDCACIWENLDYVPWRFLNRFQQRFEQRELECTGMRTRRYRRIREDEGYGPVDGGRSWFDPGDLSATYPEFDSKVSNRWNRQKKKKTRESCDDQRGNPEEESEGNIAHVSAAREDSKDYSQNNVGEIQAARGENHSFQEANREKYSYERKRRVSESPRPKKRRYADFGGKHGFKSVKREVLSGGNHANTCINSVPFSPPKTTMRNFSMRCSSNSGTEALQRRVEGKETHQQGCFIVRTGWHIPSTFTPRVNDSGSPSVEDQIRSITRSMGLSDWNRSK